ncbi:hypothetical protein QBC39DRAFT_335375 [Podospora conica]|nr:hypothetical protein QBC39DRAFT_335375 [Schizothecium conicum]
MAPQLSERRRRRSATHPFQRDPDHQADTRDPNGDMTDDAPQYMYQVRKTLTRVPNNRSTETVVQQVDLCFDVDAPVRPPSSTEAAAVVVHLSPRRDSRGGFRVVSHGQAGHDEDEDDHWTMHRSHGRPGHDTDEDTHRTTNRIVSRHGKDGDDHRTMNRIVSRRPMATTAMKPFALTVLIASILGNLVLFHLQGGFDLFAPPVLDTARLPVQEHLNAIATEVVTGMLPLFGPHSCGNEMHADWDLADALEAKDRVMTDLCSWAVDLSDQRPDLAVLCREFQAGAELATGDKSLVRLFKHMSGHVGTWQNNLGLAHVRLLVESLSAIEDAVDNNSIGPDIGKDGIRRDGNRNQTASWILAAVEETAGGWLDDLDDMLGLTQTLDDGLGAIGAAEDYITSAFERHCALLPSKIDAELCGRHLALVQKHPFQCIRPYLEPRLANALRALTSARGKLDMMVQETRLLAEKGFILSSKASLPLLGTVPDPGSTPCPQAACGRPWRRHTTLWVVEDLVTWQWKMENVIDDLSVKMQLAIARHDNFRRSLSENVKSSKGNEAPWLREVWDRLMPN